MKSGKESVHTLTGNGSEVSIDLSEELVLDDFSYEVALKSLYTSHVTPNITNDENNLFRIRYLKPYENINLDIILPEGMYEFQDIVMALNAEFALIGETPEETENLKKGLTKTHKKNFVMSLDKTTSRTKLYSTYTIDFTVDGSLASVLGFGRVILEPNITHFSTAPISITNVNVIRVECNIAKGAFLNGKRTHSIYDFYPKVPPGYKIVEQPLPMIYYPIALQSVNNITVSLKDQTGKRVDLRQENLSVTLHIRAIE